MTLSHFTSMSSETFEAYKMPKTVQRQYGQRTYVFFFEDPKAYKFQVIRGSIQKFRNGLITFILLSSVAVAFKADPIRIHARSPEFLALLELSSHLRVGESVSVPEFQGYPGNDIVVATISISGTRINNKVQI